MNFYPGKDVKINREQLADVILKLWYQYFCGRVDGHQMHSFPYEAWFDDECKTHLKMFKLAKDKDEKALTVY